jgi:hypothetical protein
MENNQVQELVDLLPGCKTTENKWVSKNKSMAIRPIDKHEAIVWQKLTVQKLFYIYLFKSPWPMLLLTSLAC